MILGLIGCIDLVIDFSLGYLHKRDILVRAACFNVTFMTRLSAAILGAGRPVN